MNQTIRNAEVRSWLLGLLLSLLLIPASADAQTKRTVTGTVWDETGAPLAGATVKVVGDYIGTATDVDGRYALSVPATARQLNFSFIG